MKTSTLPGGSRSGISFCMVLAVVSALLLTSCSAPKIVTSWPDTPQQETKKAEKVLVTVLAHRMTVRKLFENSFAEQLQTNGVASVQSYTVPATEAAPDYDSIVQAASDTGSKAVLVTRLVNVFEKTSVNKAVGRDYMVFERTEMDNILINPNPIYTSSSKTKIQLECRLYDVDTKTMVWFAVGELQKPVMTREFIDKAAMLFIDDMAEKGLL